MGSALSPLQFGLRNVANIPAKLGPLRRACQDVQQVMYNSGTDDVSFLPSMDADFARHRMQPAWNPQSTHDNVIRIPWPGFASDTLRQVLIPWHCAIRAWLIQLVSVWQRQWPQQQLLLSSQHIVVGIKYAGTVNLRTVANAVCPEVWCCCDTSGCLFDDVLGN